MEIEEIAKQIKTNELLFVYFPRSNGTKLEAENVLLSVWFKFTANQNGIQPLNKSVNHRSDGQTPAPPTAVGQWSSGWGWSRIKS